MTNNPNPSPITPEETLKEPEWYERIEPGVRSLVRMLRDNGFNTTSSCEHDSYIECDYSPDGQIKELHDLLYNYGLRDYEAVFTVKVVEGHCYNHIRLRLESKLTPEEGKTELPAPPTIGSEAAIEDYEYVTSEEAELLPLPLQILRLNRINSELCKGFNTLLAEVVQLERQIKSVPPSVIGSEGAAREIITRIVTNCIGNMWTRNIEPLENDEEADFPTEEELLIDALGLALGDDIGCLDEKDDDFRERVDLYWLEDKLAALAKAPQAAPLDEPIPAPEASKEE